MNAQRTRYEVLPTSKSARKADSSLERWSITRNGDRIATTRTKRAAIDQAITTARIAWRTTGRLGQVRIKGLDGKIQDERTYGADPQQTKG